IRKDFGLLLVKDKEIPSAYLWQLVKYYDIENLEMLFKIFETFLMFRQEYSNLQGYSTVFVSAKYINSFIRIVSKISAKVGFNIVLKLDSQTGDNHQEVIDRLKDSIDLIDPTDLFVEFGSIWSFVQLVDPLNEKTAKILLKACMIQKNLELADIIRKYFQRHKDLDYMDPA
ncbi:hypothetical protein BB560_006001, partial [Smittium megazygosporum]